MQCGGAALLFHLRELKEFHFVINASDFRNILQFLCLLYMLSVEESWWHKSNLWLKMWLFEDRKCSPFLYYQSQHISSGMRSGILKGGATSHTKVVFYGGGSWPWRCNESVNWRLNTVSFLTFSSLPHFTLQRRIQKRRSGGGGCGGLSYIVVIQSEYFSHPSYRLSRQNNFLSPPRY